MAGRHQIDQTTNDEIGIESDICGRVRLGKLHNTDTFGRHVIAFPTFAFPIGKSPWRGSRVRLIVIEQGLRGGAAGGVAGVLGVQTGNRELVVGEHRSEEVAVEGINTPGCRHQDCEERGRLHGSACRIRAPRQIA
jgi:hypothetical protein